MSNFLFTQIKLNLKHITWMSPQNYSIGSYIDIIDDYIKNIWLYNTLFSTMVSGVIDKHLRNLQIRKGPESQDVCPNEEIKEIPNMRACTKRQEITKIQYENQKMLFQYIKNAHIEIQQLKKDVSRLTNLFLEQIYSEKNLDNNLN